MVEIANIAIFILVAVGFVVVTLGISWILRPRVKDERKEIAYECGMFPQGSTEIRSHIRFYTFALLFVLFDVEILYLYPWAVRARQYGLYGLVAIGIFVGVLFLGLLYAWRKKALQWD